MKIEFREIPEKKQWWSWDEMEGLHGIYKLENDMLSAVRFMSNGTIIYFNKESGVIDIAPKNSWKGYKFIKTNEEIVLK